MGTWGRISGRRDSKCQGPGVSACLACVRESKGAPWLEQRKATEGAGTPLLLQ